jgi:hypothetical protein
MLTLLLTCAGHCVVSLFSPPFFDLLSTRAYASNIANIPPVASDTNCLRRNRASYPGGLNGVSD